MTQEEHEQFIKEGGATCPDCKQRMLKADGCLFPYITIEGKDYKRIKYGDDGMDNGRRCHDCGCKPGHIHHLGCDMETCPQCGLQLISCECDIECVFKLKDVKW